MPWFQHLAGQKNWTQPDPSAEFVMTQSAPLMITPDPDGFVSVVTH
ncbi:hypothetical protein C427_2426 [Paraglaciecola psychrophila 170]|uniref:Uncharacterized protein n=1 Tax=Paraglaciecola psychrophila 170 TaxID=1129794 RepID=M4RLM7_9ALTE|nr:hypothetical protein C427_2426 [Paraglaciecola psychrophila 170]